MLKDTRGLICSTWVAVLLSRPAEQGPALKLLRLCTAAGLIVMIGLSIPQAKKARYLLPMLPMAAIIAAYPFQAGRGRVMGWLRGLIRMWFYTTPSDTATLPSFPRPPGALQ